MYQPNEIKTMKTKLIPKSALLLVACVLVSVTRVTAQESDPYVRPVDPFAASPAGKEEENMIEPSDLSICCEVFTLSMEQAASWQREQLSESELYKRLVAGLKEKTVKQEIYNIIRSRSGQKSNNESVLEQIHPTNYEPAKMPSGGSEGVPVDPAKAKQTPATAPVEESAPAAKASMEGGAPSAFETRSLGEKIEVEPLLSPDGKTVTLRMNFEQALLAGQTIHGKGLNECKMPEIETRRFNTDLEFPIAKPHLFSTFNRPSVSKVDPNASTQVSYAFVTVTLITP
jgi:hypothetical protein